MFDWASKTKYEGSIIGHTFVARLASDPSVVVDTYTLEPTQIIDCPTTKKQQLMTASSDNVDERELESVEETTDEDELVNIPDNLVDAEENLMAGAGGSSSRAVGDPSCPSR
ncbi:unnamed protein product [Pseudo-nitzschia multistriata]|uniref:Uncharacterized protein n=1 Tax=Pseudo-nitzschia multistriata TaxID=183589 RepID=A0A448ZIH5_9STRA|nr:unnamed protein product [Pseudo-nitzschia multistriata]